MIIDQPVVSGSFFVTGSSTLVGNLVVTGSITATEGIAISGSIASASYAANAELLDGLDSLAFVLTSSYNPVSSSLAGRITVVETTYATTGSNVFTANQTICGNLTTTGTITAQTLNVQTVTSSVVYSSGSNIFGNQLTDTQELTGSVTVTGSLSVNNSPVLTQNDTGSITVLSSSFATTASYVQNAQTASFVTLAQTASYIQNAQTASFVTLAQTASYVLQAVSASFATTASYAANVPATASYALQALSSSYALTASYSANVPLTSSYALEALTASYAVTAAYSANVPVTSSYALEALSASYAQTSSYSLSGTGFPFSGSAVITGSILVTNLSGSGVRYVVTDETGLITSQTASAVIKTTQTYTASLGQTTFSVTNGYSTGYVDVFINGSKLNNTEFTDTSGTNVVLATGSFDNDIVEVVKYLPASGVSNNVLRTLTTFTAAASQSTYTVSYTPGLLDIFYNGSRLSPVEYTANNGTSFTLATASAEGDILDVMVYSYQVGAYAGIGGSGQLNQVSFYTTTSSISGSDNFTFDGSTLRVTGSIITSGSSTFTNIGPTILSGSLTVSGSITATQGIVISGSIASASYAATASGIAGGTNNYVPVWDGSNTLITGSIEDNRFNELNIFSGSNNYGTVNINAFTEPRLYLNSGNNDTLVAFNSYGQAALSYENSSGANFLIRYTGYDTKTITIQTNKNDRLTINSSGSVRFNTYTTNGLLKTTNSDGTITFATASVDYVETGSFNSLSSSFTTTSGSLSTRVTKIEGNYATTGSNIFTGAQTVCANITSTGTIIAQTLNVQQVTSSIVYSSGSNIFGCDISNVQQMTGSVRITGSLNVIGNACMTSVCSPAFVGGTVNGTTGTFSGQIVQTLGDNQILYTNTSATTGYQYMRMVSTGAQLTWGIDANPAAGLLTNSLPNSAVIGNSKNAPFHIGTNAIVRFTMDCNGISCFACELTAKTLGTNDLILNNLNYECANYVDGTRGSWLIQEGACDLFIINQVSGKKYKFNLIEIK